MKATDISKLGSQALAEIDAIARNVDPDDIGTFITELVAAKRIVLHGLGREGLMMKAFAMRLFHLGLDAHVLGDMTTPPVAEGDLLLMSAGPGSFGTIRALCETARAGGARIGCITAQPGGSIPMASDIVLNIPAQTMADDRGETTSVLPMGSLYEAAQFLVFELIVLVLAERLGETAQSMRARHTNME